MSALGGGLRNIDWTSQTLTKFEKNFYREDPRVTARSEREVEEFRRTKEIKVSCSLQRVTRRSDTRHANLICLNPFRHKAQVVPDPSRLSKKLASPITSWHPSGLPVSPPLRPSNLSLGLSRCLVGTLLPSLRPVAERPFHSPSQRCYTSMREFRRFIIDACR